jgi:hypothetical protein
MNLGTNVPGTNTSQQLTRFGHPPQGIIGEHRTSTLFCGRYRVVALSLSSFRPNLGRCPESGQIPDSIARGLAILASAQRLLPPAA